MPSALTQGPSVESLQEQTNQLAAAAAGGSMSQQQLNQLQQELYHQQLRGMAGLHSGTSMIPIQNAAAGQQLKQGSISGGFPMQRGSISVSQPSTNPQNASVAQARSFQQRYMY